MLKWTQEHSTGHHWEWAGRALTEARQGDPSLRHAEKINSSAVPSKFMSEVCKCNEQNYCDRRAQWRISSPDLALGDIPLHDTGRWVGAIVPGTEASVLGMGCWEVVGKGRNRSLQDWEQTEEGCKLSEAFSSPLRLGNHRSHRRTKCTAIVSSPIKLLSRQGVSWPLP